MTEQEFISLSVRIRGKLIDLARRFNRVSGWGGDAEDIVQDALITLWQLSRDGYPVRDAEGLAVKITKTRCVERYRRQHIRYEPVSELPLAGSYAASSETEKMDLNTIRAIVQNGLSESQLELLTLRNGEELSLDEIAAVTGRPKSSIKVSLSAARRKMLELLKKIY